MLTADRHLDRPIPKQFTRRLVKEIRVERLCPNPGCTYHTTQGGIKKITITVLESDTFGKEKVWEVVSRTVHFYCIESNQNFSARLFEDLNKNL
jgi:hypothetical protein